MYNNSCLEKDDERQMGMECEYMQLLENQPLKVKDLIQQFAEKTMQSAMCRANDLINQLFTKITKDTQEEYMFAGA